MSNLQKRLLLVGAPIASIALLSFLLSGGSSKSSLEFEGVGEILVTDSDDEVRYDIAARSTPELQLPPVNLEFLQKDLVSAELDSDVASPAAQANEPKQASPAPESESEIPLSPPHSTQNSTSDSLAGKCVNLVIFENDPDTNDFPLIPQAEVRSRENSNEFGIPEVMPPSVEPSTAPDEPGNLEAQSAEQESVSIAPMQVQETDQDAPVPFSQQIVEDEGHDVPSDQMLLAKSTTLPPAISTQIRQRLDYGTSLARRGAFASAEDVYLQVIRLIAETKDSQLGQREYTIRLASGLTALEEAEDFMTSDLRTRVRVNVENIIQGHNTTVLQSEDVSGMTSIQALQRYYEYAGEMIAGACDNEPVGSEALYFLGKLYATDSQYDPSKSAMRNAKSMIMHQSALEASAMNYRSANELGVLLAQYSRFDDAKEMLIHSVSTYPEPIAWKNLAIVHEKLGETQLAGLAFKESKIAADEATRRKTATNGPIQWVEPETFVRTGGDPQEFVDSATQQPAAPKQQEANPKGKKLKAERTAKASEWWKVWKR